VVCPLAQVDGVQEFEWEESDDPFCVEVRAVPKPGAISTLPKPDAMSQNRFRYRIGCGNPPVHISFFRLRFRREGIQYCSISILLFV